MSMWDITVGKTAGGKHEVVVQGLAENLHIIGDSLAFCMKAATSIAESGRKSDAERRRSMHSMNGNCWCSGWVR